MQNENELIRAIIDRKIKESLLAQQQNSTPNIVDRVSGIGDKLNTVGTALSSIGNGVAMSNPITAIGSLVLGGANRQRAEQAGQQTEQMAQQAIEDSKLRLPQNNLNQIAYNPTPIQQPYQQIPQQEESIKQILQNPEDIKKSAFSGVASGIDDFLAGYKENKTQGFDWNNLKSDDSKGVMQRLGEGAGTIARISQNPVVQGIVAGGLSGLFSGDPLYGLSSAFKYANSKYKANLYKDILAQQGLDVGNNNGIIDADDLSKILTARKYQKDYLSRGEYDKFRLDNGQITVDEYNALIKNPEYNPNEVLNVTGLGQVAKAGKYAQENKDSRSKNYWRNQNKGQNVVRVEYDAKPESHNYTHVIYDNGKPESKSTTYVKYENKPQKYTTPKTVTKTPAKPQVKVPPKNEERVKVTSPDGKVGTIPKSNLYDALKEGYKIFKNATRK